MQLLMEMKWTIKITLDKIENESENTDLQNSKIQCKIIDDGLEFQVNILIKYGIGFIRLILPVPAIIQDLGFLL